MTSQNVVVRATGVEKHFGHVQALRGVDLDVRAGEIVAVIGDNGAGKSTLANIIAGALQPSAGWLEVSGERIDHPTTREINRLGIEVVYQTLALAKDLTILDNLFLGREILALNALGRWMRVIDRRSMARQAKAALDQIGWDGPPLDTPVRDLSGGQQQAVAVTRAMHWATSAILLDEPTAALAARQIERTNEIIRTAARAGLGVMVITHDIPNVLTYADRIVVMRRGRIAAEVPAVQATVADLVALMVAREDEAA